MPKLDEGISLAQVRAVYAAAAAVTGADFAPLKAAVDGLCGRLFASPLAEISPKKANELVRHIGEGALSKYLDNQFDEFISVLSERNPPMSITRAAEAKRNGNGSRKKPLAEMNDAELDAKFADLADTTSRQIAEGDATLARGAALLAKPAKAPAGIEGDPSAWRDDLKLDIDLVAKREARVNGNAKPPDKPAPAEGDNTPEPEELCGAVGSEFPRIGSAVGKERFHAEVTTADGEILWAGKDRSKRATAQADVETFIDNYRAADIAGRRKMLKWKPLPGVERISPDAAMTGGAEVEQRPAAPEGPSAGEVECGKLEVIAIGQIVASPFNPRKHFPQAELQELADSLKHDGQLQNIVVRPHTLKTPAGPTYEIICGERRWRAAKIAGLADLRCVVIHVTTAKAIELAGMENYRRKDLNEIEEGRWFKEMIDGAGFKTEQALGKHLGLSQPTVSNRLRLLTLPEEWQERVITQVIPATHARELIPWAKHPPVLETVEKKIKRGKKPAEMTVKDFAELVEESIMYASRPLAGPFSIRTIEGFYRDNGEVAFKPDAGNLEALAPFEYREGRDAKVLRTFNIALWDQLQAQGVKAAAEREAKRAEKETAKRAAGALTPAQKREHEQWKKNVLEKKHLRWLTAWRQKWIVERLEKADGHVVYRLILFFSSKGFRQHNCDEAVEEAINEVGGHLKDCYEDERWHGVASIPADRLHDAIVGSLKRWLSADQEKSHMDFSQDDVADIAAMMGLDLSKHWSLTEDFLLLHTKEQIVELIQEWKIGSGIPDAATWKRGQLVERVMTPGPHHKKCPACLRALEPKPLPAVKPANGKEVKHGH